MSIVNIKNIQLLNNPARFEDDYNFRITFECVEPLKEDIEWKLLYVGDAKSEEFDQELDSCMVGPVPVGVNSFDFTASAPQPALLPSVASEEILGVTVLILTGSYRDKEFVRVGYYVNTEYEDEARRENPPAQVHWNGLIRNVLVEKPRVTRFNNPWDQEEKRAKGWPATTTTTTTTTMAGGGGQGMDSFAASKMSLVGGGQGPLASALPPPVIAQPAQNGNGTVAGDVEMA